MAIPNPTGIFDINTSTIIAPNGLTWDDIGAGDSAADNNLQSWDDWKSWVASPSSFTWVTETIDLEKVVWSNLTWTIDCVGTPSYVVYYSTTGEFAGEESTLSIAVGDENIAAIYARYIAVQITITPVPSEGVASITSFEWNASSERLTLLDFDLNSANLGGSNTARELTPPKLNSKILAMRITPIASDYVEDSYVASGYIQATAAPYPYIVSKDRTTPTIAFLDNAGNNADSEFDIEYSVLPEQFMDGRNLRKR